MTVSEKAAREHRRYLRCEARSSLRRSTAPDVSSCARWQVSFPLYSCSSYRYLPSLVFPIVIRRKRAIRISLLKSFVVRLGREFICREGCEPSRRDEAKKNYLAAR